MPPAAIFLLHLIAVGALAVLAAFAVRRMIFTATLLRAHPSPPHDPGALPLLLLVPARDESRSLPGLLAALDALDYPPDRLRVVLIDDGSRDDTGRSMSAAAAARGPAWQALLLPGNVGKAQALNLALAAHSFGEVVYVFDADHRPRPDCLRIAAAAFDDRAVAGVSGRAVPAQPLASAAAYYGTVESMVHQLITMRAKDLLGLAPALLGSNTGYRRRALAEVGGFRPGAFLEDSDLTLSLHRAGYRTRFIPEAISAHHVPATVRGYVQQHLRWGRGFHDVARAHLGPLLADRRLSLALRIELAMFALGYLDRLALLAAIGVAVALLALGIDRGPIWLALQWGIAISVLLPSAQIVAAFIHDRAPAGMWLRLPAVPAFFALDALVAVWSAIATVFSFSRVWHRTERA